MRLHRNTLLRIVTTSGSFSLLKGQLRFLSQKGWNVIGVAGEPENRLQQLTEAEGITSIFIPHLVRPISPANDLKAFLELIRAIKKEKPLIVHANTPKGSLLGMLAAWYCRVPHRIYTVTGLRFETATGLFRRLLIAMERITCLCATKVIPEGDGVAATLRRERITAKPLKKILNGNINGVDLEYYSRNQSLEEAARQIKAKIGEGFTFIFVGRIVRDKGIIELIEAFQRLQKEHSECRLVLLGRQEPDLDPIRPSTLQAIKDNPAIFEAGWQNDVRPWLAAADALAFPSYREGFPNVVMQAGAMSLPSIVTDINGCNEIIIEGENGYIVPPRDPQALYQRMKNMVEDTATTKMMAQKARPLIAERYEQQAVWEAILSEYQKLTKQ
ncbi:MULTISPECIES: glycosyltransferase family 4 protein [Bacteroidales]|uniref:Glycosyltransferase involved in cell wall biosynthesis n=1 Tax=Porphyromonas loveana TaxID=1884669 RepID=A0A2U1FPN7_9PORP|nr:glycosyltransferase family 4 protein [Porphyromonas loveana]PVZ14106.1 glycosyltransferase involved in cell wall biosynthesis [Porphyromonas loveana]